MNKWRPHTGGPVQLRGSRPAVGDVVAWEHAAWRVEHVADATLRDNETEKYSHEWLDRSPDYLPYHVSMRRIHGPAHLDESGTDPGLIGLRVRAGPSHPLIPYNGGRVPLCSCHGHPWPCIDLERERAADTATRQFRDLTAKAEAGACTVCGEPVTVRQASIRYPEGDVRLPLAAPPVFHARLSCRDGVVAYERERQLALSGVSMVVHVTTHEILRDNNGREVIHAPDSYQAAFERALRLGEINEDGRNPRTNVKGGTPNGRRDMWRAERCTGRGECLHCRRGRVEYIGGNGACALTFGCRRCVTEWVASGPQQPDTGDLPEPIRRLNPGAGGKGDQRP